MVAEIVESGGFSELPGEDAETKRDTPAAVFRLGVNALVRMKSFDQLAAAVLDSSGQPRVRWWPVAYALQRLEDKRGLDALLTLVQETQPHTRAFAIKGLGALKARAAVPTLVPLVSMRDRALAVESVRALGRIGDPAGGAALLGVVRDNRADVVVRSE